MDPRFTHRIDHSEEGVSPAPRPRYPPSPDPKTSLVTCVPPVPSASGRSPFHTSDRSDKSSFHDQHISGVGRSLNRMKSERSRSRLPGGDLRDIALAHTIFLVLICTIQLLRNVPQRKNVALAADDLDRHVSGEWSIGFMSPGVWCRYCSGDRYTSRSSASVWILWCGGRAASGK